MTLTLIVGFVACGMLSWGLGYWMRVRLESHNPSHAFIEDDSKRGEAVRVFDPDEKFVDRGLQLATFPSGSARNLVYLLEYYGVKVELKVLNPDNKEVG